MACLHFLIENLKAYRFYFDETTDKLSLQTRTDSRSQQKQYTRDQGYCSVAANSWDGQ